ncbi:UDP-N-acetylmuramoyl-tripeptide--D-alanyl-D-alanine ligase [Alkalithermobacter paradoxus]|uniref:UDP-N-acetylmuramoyl-tripeptide--D-alanyl-D-alanine ligase n=1 Tax=Alkalithermobacter paradoxus TaxID=29349 RepID=A0A1V4IA68_9FIRM|nr:UDP-N-acetylmuramoyl-tripeptide--D-alanyl-D-alanine ligase [[Clostridium] thermoalcaliphilum]
MKPFSVNQISQIIKGNIIYWDNNKYISSFVEEFVAPKSSCLYFLLYESINEDKLLQSLVKNNASGIVIRSHHKLNMQKWIDANIGIIEVDSVREAYLSSAKFYRFQFNIPFIQVVGSSGKTSTKDMIGYILNESIDTLVGAKNYNAPSGVAYNIFNLDDKHKAAVLEAGMKGLGIISLSSDIISPSIGVITCINSSHISNLGSMENIIKAKGEILDYLGEDSTLIINGEDENCKKLPLHKFKGKMLTFGFSDSNDIWASDIKYENFKTFFTANFNNMKLDCVINTFGKYYVLNSLAAIMVGITLGLSRCDIYRGLSKFNLPPARQELLVGINNSFIINDNFNGNPDSTKSLIMELPNISKDHPLILVMGDIEKDTASLEEYAVKSHFMLGEEISKLNFHRLIAVGKWAKHYIDGALNKGIDQEKLSYYKTVEDAQADIINSIIPGSIILFKAHSSYVDFQNLINKIKA